jgi:hypothetical protein
VARISHPIEARGRHGTSKVAVPQRLFVDSWRPPMQTQCAQSLFEFETVARRDGSIRWRDDCIERRCAAVKASGRRLDTAGAARIGATAASRALRRDTGRTASSALGYEDLNGETSCARIRCLRGWPPSSNREDCAPVASQSTPNGREHRPKRNGREVPYDRLHPPGGVAARRSFCPLTSAAREELIRWCASRPRRRLRHRALPGERKLRCPWPSDAVVPRFCDSKLASWRR